MSLSLITEVKHLARRYVLVRIDCNVPLLNRKITDISRLREVLPTLRWLERKRARIILAGHLGRPDGKAVPDLSLRPIGYALGKILRRKVKVMSFNANPHLIRTQAKNHIVLLENLRFAPGEESNDKQFAAQLANLADIYVNEAFSASHRPAASLVAITGLLPSYAGLYLAQELKALEKIKQRDARPVVVIIGGAKVSDKLLVIEKLLPRSNAVLVGGGVANTFLAANGCKVGSSLIDKKVIPQARRLLRSGKSKIVLPIDVIVAKASKKFKTYDWCLAKKVTGRDKIVDLGTATTQLYAAYIKSAKTIFWSGPLGLVEEPTTSHASLALGRLAAARSHNHTFVLVGGGDTAAFFHKHNFAVSHVSTAGGAMLEFLAGKKLAGLKALGYYNRG